jgi:hypothetical protein
MPYIPTPRSYRVEYRRDLRPLSAFDWSCLIYGDGHWCTANGHRWEFRTEAEAKAAGECWVLHGRREAPEEAAPSLQNRKAA